MFVLAKILILILLLVDSAIYAETDTVAALDDLAWLGLLALIDVETRCENFPLRRLACQGVRYVLAILVVSIFIDYVGEALWLDVLNTGLWFLMIVLMEIEVRYPDFTRFARQYFVTAYIAIFLCLFAMVGVWIGQGDWFDAYDACLWIAAFAMIEVDILRFLRIECTSK